jgi:predicted MFS family arabinose efflux permease
MTEHKSDRGSVATRYSYFVLGVLALVYGFSYVDRQLVSALAEPIKMDLGLSDTQLGLLTGTIFALFYATFGVPAAWIADRTKRVRIIAIACGLWSLFTALCGAAHSFAQLAWARVGVGIGEAGGLAPSLSIISDYFPPIRRGTAIAVYTLATPIGSAFAVAYGAWITAEFGWRAAFISLGIPGVVLALLLPFLVREPKRGRHDVMTVGSPVSLLSTLKLFAKTKRLLMTVIGSGFSGIVQYVLLAWTPAFLMRVRGMTLPELGTYYSTCVGISVACGSLLSGIVLDRLLKKTPRAYGLIPSITVLVAIPFYVGALLSPSWQLALPLFAATQFLTVAFQAPAVAAIQNFVPASQRSTASAVFLMCINLAALGLGPMFVGAVSDLARPHFGAQSLKIALLAVVPIFLLAFIFNYLSSQAMKDHREEVTA